LKLETLVEEIKSYRGDWEPEDYSKRMLLPTENLAIVSDVHIPYHDEVLLAHVLREAHDYKVETIVWLGDLMDMPTYSSWGNLDKSTTFLREKHIVRKTLERVAELGFKQVWSSGNHENRLFRKNDFTFGMEDLAGLCGLTSLIDSGRLLTSDNPTLDAFGGRWMLTHPAQYGSTPLVVPGKLATRFQQNVMSAHAHHYGMGMDETGMFTVVETGGLFKPQYHQYIQHQVTAHRAWVQGFWLLINDGTPVGFNGRDYHRATQVRPGR
jgi:hypothetical protein